MNFALWHLAISTLAYLRVRRHICHFTARMFSFENVTHATLVVCLCELLVTASARLNHFLRTCLTLVPRRLVSHTC